MTKQYSPREIVDWLRGMKLHSVYADLYEAAAQAVERTPLAKHEDALNAVLGPPAEPKAEPRCTHPLLKDNPDQPGVNDYICDACGKRVLVYSFSERTPENRTPSHD